MLSQLFTSFDIECNNLNLYKVYTIGDCYVVMSVLDKNKRKDFSEECENVVELGFRMIEIIARVRESVKFDALHMRIGIHTGKVMGGVIGTGIVRYDLYGQDVLIANKMESSGESDRVHISGATKDLLYSSKNRQKYIFLPVEKPCFIDTLNKSVDTYFLDKKSESFTKKAR
jgi:class 3 adenylate cyclase